MARQRDFSRLNLLEQLLLNKDSFVDADMEMPSPLYDSKADPLGSANDELRRIWTLICQIAGAREQIEDDRQELLESVGTATPQEKKRINRKLIKLLAQKESEDRAGIIANCWWKDEVCRQFPKVGSRESFPDDQWMIFALSGEETNDTEDRVSVPLLSVRQTH